MRWIVTEKFNETISSYLPKLGEIALVGGGPDEAELEIFGHSVQTTFLGIEPIPGKDFVFLDLNTFSELDRTFDLVICSQVLEHVWNHQAVFDNLAKLVKPGGLLWMGCPASNYPHGSPGYFSAGFTPEYLEKNLGQRYFELITGGTFGSSRYYFLTHALQIWGGKKMNAFPLFFGFSRFYPKEFFGRLYALTRSGRIRNDIRFATESFVLLRKKI
jgi:SAM-dependent methyltransferase